MADAGDHHQERPYEGQGDAGDQKTVLRPAELHDAADDRLDQEEHPALRAEIEEQVVQIEANDFFQHTVHLTTYPFTVRQITVSPAARIKIPTPSRI